MQTSQQINQEADMITHKIQELIKNQFTGSVTVSYHFLKGHMMGIEFLTKEYLREGGEMINFNDFGKS